MIFRVLMLYYIGRSQLKMKSEIIKESGKKERDRKEKHNKNYIYTTAYIYIYIYVREAHYGY